MSILSSLNSYFQTWSKVSKLVSEERNLIQTRQSFLWRRYIESICTYFSKNIFVYLQRLHSARSEWADNSVVHSLTVWRVLVQYFLTVWRVLVQYFLTVCRHLPHLNSWEIVKQSWAMGTRVNVWAYASLTRGQLNLCLTFLRESWNVAVLTIATMETLQMEIKIYIKKILFILKKYSV